MHPPRPDGPRIIIGVDVHVGNRAIEILDRFAIDCYSAADGEPDMVWFDGARRAGAAAIASPDFDLYLLCERYSVPLIRLKVRQGFNHLRQAQAILSKLIEWRWIVDPAMRRAAAKVAG